MSLHHAADSWLASQPAVSPACVAPNAARRRTARRPRLRLRAARAPLLLAQWGPYGAGAGAGVRRSTWLAMRDGRLCSIDAAPFVSVGVPVYVFDTYAKSCSTESQVDAVLRR